MFGGILIPASLGLKKNPSQHGNAPTLTDTHTFSIQETNIFYTYRWIRPSYLKERLKNLKIYDVNNKISYFPCD